MDKTTLLQVLDAIADEAAEKEKVLQVAHDENVSAWMETIAQWMNAQPMQAISLLELQRSLPISLLEIWIALLLDGYRLEQRGAFTVAKCGLHQVESENVMEQISSMVQSDHCVHTQMIVCTKGRIFKVQLD